MIKGIDVSEFQETIDWDAVKNAGIQFAIIRAGYGNNNLDEQFKRNISECNRLGIPCGVYWFSYALNADNAAREASQVIAAIKDYTVEYPVCYDLEYDTIRYAKTKGVIIDKAMATDFVKAFCSTVEAAGYYVMNYSNYDYSKNMFDMAALSRYDLWYAYYNDTSDRSDVGIWQHSSTGQVPGISGKVDLNTANMDYPDVIRGAGLNHLGTKPTPAAITKGSTVKLRAGADTYTGGSLASFVYDRTYTVMELSGDRAVIGIGGVVTAAVKVGDLTKV